MELREYQKEIIHNLINKSVGNYLIQLPTGCGKTICFTTYININQHARVLILSHRDELVNQPIKYINRPVGIEMGKHISNGESVISTCVPSMVRRLDKFPKDYFDVIIIDECHHSASPSYKKILNYFTAKCIFGFTATPNRNDGVRLNDIFDKIIYKANLIDMVKNGYLSDIKCTRSYLNFNLNNVKTSNGDFDITSLGDEMKDTAKGVAKIYKEKAVGQTLIFGTTIAHCENIQKEIPNSVLVTASTKNRKQIIDDFTNRRFRCLINCMIFTEGTDIPLIETIIIARPTLNESLYTQMVGRGLRLYPDKTHLNLIDCVGVSNNLDLCTAPSLVGAKYIDKKMGGLKCESLIDLPDLVKEEMDDINIWKINYKLVNIWAKKQKYRLHNINFYQLPNGDLTLKLPNTKLIKIKYPDELGKSNDDRDFQDLLDECYLYLMNNHEDYKYLWDLNIIKKWGKYPASDNQISTIRKFIPDIESNLTKLEASQILNKLFNK